MRYKIVKIDAKQKDFIEKYKVSACTYCDYSEGYLCTFRGRRCPAGNGRYLEKIYKFKNKKDEVQNSKNE